MDETVDYRELYKVLATIDAAVNKLISCVSRAYDSGAEGLEMLEGLSEQLAEMGPQAQQVWQQFTARIDAKAIADLQAKTAAFMGAVEEMQDAAAAAGRPNLFDVVTRWRAKRG